MYKSKKLPWVLSYKMKTAHDIYIFNGDYYMNLLPFVLYKINGLDYYFDDKRNFNTAVWVGELYNFDVKIYNPKKQEYVNLGDDENLYQGEISKQVIDSLKNRYKNCIEIANESISGWIEFDVVLWIKENISELIEVDLYRAEAWAKGVESKKYKIDQFKEHRDHLGDYDRTIMFNQPEYVDQFVRYLTKELQQISFDTHYKDIYSEIKNGTMSLEEFLQKI